MGVAPMKNCAEEPESQPTVGSPGKGSAPGRGEWRAKVALRLASSSICLLLLRRSRHPAIVWPTAR